MTPKEMQEEWLKNNEVTKCETTHMVSTGKWGKHLNKYTCKSTIPNRFERATKHCTCLLCGEHYTPYKPNYTKKAYSLICRKCIKDNGKAKIVKKMQALSDLRQKLRELDITTTNISIVPNSTLETYRDTYIAITDKTNHVSSKAKQIYKKVIEELDLRYKEKEANPNMSITGYEFDF